MHTLGVLVISILAGSVLGGCGDGSSSGSDGGIDAGGGGDVDAASVDAGGALDAAAGEDAAVGDDAGSDAGTQADAGPPCTEAMMGACPGTLACLGCPSGPITEHYLCTTACTSDEDCTDAARPTCNRDTTPGGGGGEGICTSAEFVCRWGVRCAAPDTMIATPSGERRIDELREGDLVWSAGAYGMIAVPLAMVSRTPALDHRVVRVVLETGRVLEISPGHPTADGRTFADLRAGDAIDGVAIVSAEIVPYVHPFTYDVLPASETGTYVAGGALIGSTLF